MPDSSGMVVVAVAGFSLGALFFFGLMLLASFSRQEQIHSSRMLATAAAISALWSTLLGFQAYGISLPVTLLLSIEILRGGLWLIFLLSLIQTLGKIGRVRVVVAVLGISILLVGFLVEVLYRQGVIDFGVGNLFPGVGLLLAVTVLLAVEQLYKNSPPGSRWALKFFCVGIVTIFAYDLFLYSQSLLVNSISLDAWAARGYVNAMAVALMVVAIRRQPSWSVNLFVSRDVVLYTTTFTAVGLYLLLMAFGGYYIKLFGGSWGGFAQILFLCVGVLLVVALSFSSTVRSRINVFVSKNLLSNKYDYRKEWLRFVETMAEVERNRDIREVAIQAVGQIIDSPAGTMWTYDEATDKYRQAASWNIEDLALSSIAVSDDVIKTLREKRWLVEVPECIATPELYDGLVLPPWMTEQPRTWLIIPLLHGSAMAGFITLYEPVTVTALNYEDRDLLKTVGSHIATHLLQHEADQRLNESRQFEAYNRLTAFVMHDLSNIIAQQSLVVRNAAKYRNSPEFVDDAFKTVEHSVERMNRLLDTLRTGPDHESKAPLEIGSLLAKVILRCSDRLPRPVAEFESDDLKVVADSEQLAAVIEHAIRNAQDASQAEGYIRLGMRAESGKACLSIEDGGVGMTEDFIRNRLFKPFDTTKGTKGMGIGMYQMREYVRSLGGRVEVSSVVGRGTCLSIQVPLFKP